jgi:hypothetical protein
MLYKHSKLLHKFKSYELQKFSSRKTTGIKNEKKVVENGR